MTETSANESTVRPDPFVVIVYNDVTRRDLVFGPVYSHDEAIAFIEAKYPDSRFMWSYQPLLDPAVDPDE